MVIGPDVWANLMMGRRRTPPLQSRILCDDKRYSGKKPKLKTKGRSFALKAA
jgi:hypothetical protein